MSKVESQKPGAPGRGKRSPSGIGTEVHPLLPSRGQDSTVTSCSLDPAAVCLASPPRSGGGSYAPTAREGGVRCSRGCGLGMERPRVKMSQKETRTVPHRCGSSLGKMLRQVDGRFQGSLQDSARWRVGQSSGFAPAGLGTPTLTMRCCAPPSPLPLPPSRCRVANSNHDALSPWFCSSSPSSAVAG